MLACHVLSRVGTGDFSWWRCGGATPFGHHRYGSARPPAQWPAPDSSSPPMWCAPAPTSSPEPSAHVPDRSRPPTSRYTWTSPCWAVAPRRERPWRPGGAAGRTSPCCGSTLPSRGPAGTARRRHRRLGHTFRALGYPAGADDGVWASGTLRDGQGLGWVQMEANEPGPPIAGGFSGSPVWDDLQNGVVGMTVAAHRGRRTAYLLPSADLIDEETLSPRCPFRDWRRSPRTTRSSSTAVTATSPECTGPCTGGR